MLTNEQLQAIRPAADALMEFRSQSLESARAVNEQWKADARLRFFRRLEWWLKECVERGEYIEHAISRITTEANHVWNRYGQRTMLFVPNGTYHLSGELNFALAPWLDMVGESREGTVLTFAGKGREAAIWLRGTNTLLAHMTIERTGAFSEPTGYGVRYAIHDNTLGIGPREVIVADVECRTDAALSSNGIGTGLAGGGLHFYAGLRCPFGMFAHNGDDWRENWERGLPRPGPQKPGALVYVDCVAGGGEYPPGEAFRYWNTGSQVQDDLIVCGGQYRGVQHGMSVIDFGPPFHGDSETRLVLMENPDILRLSTTERTTIERREASK